MRIAAHHPALLLLLAIACNPAVQADEEEEEVPTLKSLAEYPVGVAIQARHLTESTRTALITSTFSSITAEYEMKPNPISTGPGSYNWQRADALVEFAEENDMQVHGHALVWHETVPNWMQNFGGSDAEFEAAVKEYVTTVVQRYRGRVVSWDVINEAFENGSGALRNSVFHRRMGDDYLARLFRYAREADPDVLLFYNDYGTPGDRNKRRAMLEMIDDFQERGIPIDGVGLQMHVTLTFPQLSDIIETIDEIVKRGLRVHISELDVRVNADGGSVLSHAGSGTAAEGTREGHRPGIPPGTQSTAVRHHHVGIGRPG